MSGSEGFVRRLADVDAVPCPCGDARRIVTAEDNEHFSVHRVRIEGEAKRHYHKRLQECYVILEGAGEIELGNACFAVAAGDTVLIPPGTEHALRGHFEIINIVSPPFDPADEFVVE